MTRNEFLNYMEYIFSHVYEENKLLDQKITAFLGISSIVLILIVDISQREGLGVLPLLSIISFVIGIFLALFALFPKHTGEFSVKISELGKELRFMPPDLREKFSTASSSELANFASGIETASRKVTTSTVGEKLCLRIIFGLRIVRTKERLLSCALLSFLIGVSALVLHFLAGVPQQAIFWLLLLSITFIFFFARRTSIYKLIINK